MVVFTNYALRALLTDITQDSGGVAGVLHGAKAHLFINAIVPTVDSIVSNFSEATFTSYASATITWNTPAYTNGNNQAELTGGTLVFVSGSAPTLQTVYGAFVTDSGGTNLLWAERFTIPVVINSSGDGVTYVPALVPTFLTGIPQSMTP
jgi:hypothetical protein